MELSWDCPICEDSWTVDDTVGIHGERVLSLVRDGHIMEHVGELQIEMATL